MPHYIWIGVNLLFIVCSAIYIWLTGTQISTLITTGKIFSQLAILLFLINVNMYFIFLVIRKSTDRNIKVLLAKISRKMMKAHIPIAVSGTSLILIHAIIMITQMHPYISLWHPKMISGYVSIFFLIVTLIGGYRRYIRASGFRRKFHLIMAMVFALFFTVHLFWPI